MATFNGARFLREQLDSIAAQTNAHWRLLISDDGSNDDTIGIIRQFAIQHPERRIELIDGPRRGATANFLHLIERAEPETWIAFSDQDDVWMPQKLSRAADWLSIQNGTAIYAARTTICDDALNKLAPAPHFPGPFCFQNALVQACLPGNTIVANGRALALLKAGAGAARKAGVISHDWWIYQLLSGAGAEIYRDQDQVLLYRQHLGNEMGRNDTFRARVARASMLFDGRFATWLARNLAALQGSQGLLTPQNRELLAGFAEILAAPGPAALARSLRIGLRRQTTVGSVALLSAIALGRLKRRDIDGE